VYTKIINPQRLVEIWAEFQQGVVDAAINQ